MTITSVSARIEKEFYIEITYVDDYESEDNDRIDEADFYDALIVAAQKHIAEHAHEG